MATVVENLQNFGVRHDISKYFSSQPEGLEVSLFIHVPDIDQEGIFTIVKLNHLHKASFPEVTLEVDS